MPFAASPCFRRAASMPSFAKGVEHFHQNAERARNRWPRSGGFQTPRGSRTNAQSFTPRLSHVLPVAVPTGASPRRFLQRRCASNSLVLDRRQIHDLHHEQARDHHHVHTLVRQAIARHGRGHCVEPKVSATPKDSWALWQRLVSRRSEGSGECRPTVPQSLLLLLGAAHPVRGCVDELLVSMVFGRTLQVTFCSSGT